MVRVLALLRLDKSLVLIPEAELTAERSGVGICGSFTLSYLSGLYTVVLIRLNPRLEDDSSFLMVLSKFTLDYVAFSNFSGEGDRKNLLDVTSKDAYFSSNSLLGYANGFLSTDEED
jgi:hypothetical protein